MKYSAVLMNSKQNAKIHTDHTRGSYQVLTGLKNDAACSDDSTVLIPQTWDLTRAQMIKRDISRNTNTEDHWHHQPTVLAETMA